MAPCGLCSDGRMVALNRRTFLMSHTAQRIAHGSNRKYRWNRILNRGDDDGHSSVWTRR